MYQPKFDKDIELLKINLAAEEWRGSFLMKIGTLLTAFVALSAVLVAAEYANQITWVVAIFGVVVSGIFVLVASRRLFVRPYQKRLQSSDILLKKVHDGESIGELRDLLKERY